MPPKTHSVNRFTNDLFTAALPYLPVKEMTKDIGTMVDIFILNTVENYLGIQNGLIFDAKSKDNLTEFITNPHNMVLQVFLEENNCIQIVTEVLNNEAKSILFYKISPQELTEPNSVNNLNIITLSTPAETLYLTLKQIYLPLLSEAKDLLSNDIQQNIVDLESNLRVLTQKTGSKDVILSIQDEMAYWLTVSERKNASKKEKEAADSFYEMFKDINEEIRIIQSSAMSENKTSVENIGGILDDVWRLNTFLYPEQRMTHVIDIISFSVCSTIRTTLSTEDLWTIDTQIQDGETLTISQCLEVVQTWIEACKSLTKTFWPNYAMHPWSGKPYVSKYCVNFEARLSQISDIKSIHSQLVKLLTPLERSELRTEQMFDSFKNVNIWNCNGKNQAWDSAEAKFSAMLKPAEGKVAEKLKPRLHNTSTKQMLYEFLRYKTLISRPTVKQALSNELEIFVSLLVAMLRNIQSQLHAEDSDVRMYQPSEMSSVVQQVQWAKKMEAKVVDIQTCADKYLNNFEESTTLSTLASTVIKELKAMYTQLHEDWSRDLQAQVNSGTLKLSLDKPVVEFSNSNNMMVVNFNPKTVSAGIEARSMAALGLPPPAIVTEALDGLSKLLHHARYLQQVASFHNTMGERMIPSTRPMMLKAALDLSSLVQDQKAVYWDNEEQVANYTDKLKKAVMELETQNSYLTTQHLAIRSIVASLVETELLSKQMEWKKKLNEIRDIIEKVESNGYKNTDSWRTHWDWQLYKALECQYMKTLLSLHKHFPTVKVDLVLRGRTVKTYPPLEEIRVQHYQQLRRFISLPTQFVGLQTAVKDGSSIFSAIVDKHSWMGNKSVTQIESTLSSLERVCVDWTRRAALACVADLEQLCKDNLKEPKDWEINFKACKAYGQAVAKVNFEDEKIEWITVGTAGLRREFEAQVRNLWSALISSLQSNCRDDSATLDSFMASAMLTLENRAMPKNAKELAEISAKQQTLKEKMPEMEKLVDDLKQKGHMLRTWGGDPSVNNTLKEWQKIHELMLTNQQLFEHQAEIVKSSLTGELENINTSLEAWFSRWCQNRSRYEDTRNVSYEDMVQRCSSVFDAQAQLEKFVNDRDEILKECDKFNLKSNVPKTWTEAEKKIKEDILLWTPLKEYHEEYTTLADQDWIVFQKKLHLLDELVAKWVSKLEPFTTVTLFLQQELMKYSDLAPLLKYLRGADFTELHWREIYSLLEMECKKSDTLLVRDLLKVSLNIKKQVKTLQKISATASSESAIRSTLNELELWYAGARITVVYYKDKAQQPIPIVKEFKEILAKIEEQQWAVTSARGGGGGDTTTAWEARLRYALTLLRSLHHAQRRWLYLEPILSNDDGELGTKFRKVDLGFKQVARTVESDPRLSALLMSLRLQPMLDSILEQLHACQSALNQYIDNKRTVFPRLYFLSDDDLLELLGQARAGSEGRELVMQNHLKKLFPGITGVKLGPNGMSITALCSSYDEVLQLERPVDIDCPVELWLKNLETEMRSSLKTVTLKYLTTNASKQQDPLSLPTQVICLAQNIRFTELLEKAINTKELHKLKSNIESENKFYMEYDVVDDNERSKRQALILQCAHYFTVIRSLIENNVSTTSHWLWQKELRFYVIGNKEIVARVGMAEIPYSYEYLGVNTGQFVRTELANECFLILTQALHLGLVGNPFGPAGTGKTESVKALGGLVGRLVLVFNCDEAMDAKCMSRLLTGLSLSGAWGCFDELNRLSSDTLAEISHQFSAVMQRDNVVLDQKQITVSPWCGIAATMNPVGRGYGGRRALPADLERTLRPVALSSPKGDELARHLLYARAVENAEVLAVDLYTVFAMASELLTAERHYDWGLRALKAAVGSCGVALSTPNASKSLATQKAVLRRVLTLNNLSKLTRHDALRFEEILSMVFPDVTHEEVASNPIVALLQNSVKNLELIHNELQIQKCIELYEQLQQRMGVVIVGAPGSGKTTIRRLLKDALKQQGKSVVEYVICPKAMNRKCLLGHIDHDTRQWTDGVISTTALEVSNQSNDIWSWIVCDGDIDPEWIEALNSVLDDNRLLTLPSGWRIQFPNNVNFIFETHSLEHASPATITRMGIILLSDEDSCATELLEKWLLKAEVEHETAKMAIPLLGKVVKKCVNWLAQHQTDTIMKTYGVSVVQQILTQFEYVAQNVGVSVINTAPEELVYTAVQRSVMGLLKPSAQEKFRDEMSEVLGMPPIQPILAGEWIEEDFYLSRRLARSEASIRAIVASSHSHLLVIGPHASAKNTLTEYILRNSNTSSLLIILDCTPVLQPADIIMELKRHNAASTGGRGSAVNSKEVASTLFIRGLHRASRDEWGSSPVQAFLLQLIQHGGFWEQSNGGESGRGVQWCSVHRVRLVASIASTLLCPRLCGAWACVTVEEPDNEEIHELASKALRQNVNKSVSDKEISSIAESMMNLYKQVSEEFVSHLHYKWNASDIRKWCTNIKWYDTSNSDELLAALTAEADKIFQIRLVTDQEKAKYSSIANRCLKTNNNSNYFIPKLRGAGVFLERVDERIWTQHVNKIINQCLTEQEHSVFGSNGAEACKELTILCPVYAMALNGGLVVSVASTGMGRRAAAHIVSTALSAHIVCINHTSEFNTQFKNALSSCGTDGNRTLVLVTESAVTELALGHIEALLKARTVQTIPRDLMPTLGHAQPDTNFVDNIKQNLGIVINLDIEQKDLFEIIDQYPMLYKDSHLVWQQHWCDETLRSIPKLTIERLRKETAIDGITMDGETVPVDGFVSIHKSLSDPWMQAPCRYVNFVKTYYNIVCTKKDALLQRQTILSSGVEALRRARSEVAKLKADAAEQEVALSEKQAKANHALDQIGATVRAATDKKEEMHELKKNIEKENEILQIRKKEIEVELASVEPVIAAARAAVGDIKAESLSESFKVSAKRYGRWIVSGSIDNLFSMILSTTYVKVSQENLREVRSLRAPPDVVRDVLEGVLRLMGIADTSWHSMKSFLSKRGVKEDIRCLDASQITAEAAESVRRLLERRGGSFDERTSKRASAACAPLAAWVRANLAYVDASAKVRPLQARQRELSNNLKEAENQLEALSSGLASVDERVASLKQKLGKYTKDAAAIELRLATATQTITAADGLLEQLVDEFDAWENDLEYISKEISELSVRSLLAAAYVVYLPDCTEPEARTYIKKWSTLIGFEDETFSVINFLSNTEKQLKWDADGLPSDQSAVKNAILIDQFLESSRYGFTPLIIDPDGDAMSWLKSSLSHIPCDVISQQSTKLQTAVQYAVRLGRLLLVTEVDDIHASWAPLLLGLSLAGAAGRVILYSRDVTLPKRLPAYRRAVLSVVNFTARVDGLTDQLVHYALQEQNPQVNEKSREIKLKKATLQKQQYELQENLLKDLSKNNDILNDANLLASLKKTRSSTATIAEALQAARDIEAQTRTACEAFEPTAKRTAVLALAVKELTSHKPLIALPLDAVLDVYVDAVKQEGRNSNQVVKYVSRRLIERVLLGLHEKDKYIMVLHLLKQVYDSFVPDELWQIFLGGTQVLECDSDIVSDIRVKFPWLLEESLKKLAAIQSNHSTLFNKLSMDNISLWNDFYQSGDLKLITKLQLSPFENVLAVAIMRPESLYRAIVFFVDQILGVGVMCKGNEIEVGTAWSGDRTPRPLLLLGSHATDHLVAYAAAKNQTLQKVLISDGAAVWEKAVEDKKAGGWVCIEVGASRFTSELRAFVTSFSQSTVSDFGADFRLWIVSEDRDIPPIISNSCVNIILEPPEGIKNNVLNTLSAWGNYENNDVKLVRARACLAYLHALVQERRAYIPQGWSRVYAWGWGDVSASSLLLCRGVNALCVDSARALCRHLYAARVRTPPDRALLYALHQECLGEQTLAHSWKPRGVNVQLPFGKQLQAYASAFSALPNIDTPQMLGLPDNCRAAWETRAAHKIVQGLKELNSVVSISKADGSTSLRPLLNLWKKLMSGNTLLKGDPIPDMAGWWGCVCHSEALSCARAVSHIHRALVKMRANNSQMHLHKVPEDWQVLWSGPDAPELYIKELSYRANEAVRRMKHYDSNNGLFPTEIDLRGLFSVRGLVAAVKASAARTLACSPHLLTPSVHWTNIRQNTKRSDEISITLTGLQLSGAIWESALKPGDGCSAPPIVLTYVQSNNAVHLDSTHFNVPVYNNEAREEVLFYAPAPLDPRFDSVLATLNAVALFVPYH